MMSIGISLHVFEIFSFSFFLLISTEENVVSFFYINPFCTDMTFFNTHFVYRNPTICLCTFVFKFM